MKVLSYGLSPAFVLVEAVQRLARHGQGAVSLPPDITRASLIRTLSVFVSQLDTACDGGDTNYDVCMRASKAISRSLDEVLNSQTPASAGLPASPDHTPHMTAATDDMAFDNLASSIWDDYDLSGWMKDIDWSGLGAEWSNF